MVLGLVVWALALGASASSPAPAALQAAMGAHVVDLGSGRAAASLACDRSAPSPSAAASVDAGDDPADHACSASAAGRRVASPCVSAPPARVVDRAPAHARAPRGPPSPRA